MFFFLFGGYIKIISFGITVPEFKFPINLFRDFSPIVGITAEISIFFFFCVHNLVLEISLNML